MRAVALAAALVLALGVALSIGPTHVSLGDVGRALLSPLRDDGALSESARAVVLTLRLPRALLAACVGCTLGVAGASVQGLFRNPLAEPGLVGVSAGGTLGAALAIVVGGPLFALIPDYLRGAVLPLAAFAGCFGVTELVLRAGTVGGRTSALVMILAGIAVNAFVGALIGSAAFWANDRQLRDLVFWTLGSFSNATTTVLLFSAPLMVVAVALLLGRARSLNLLSLGDLEAQRLGLSVARTKRLIVLAIALGVGASVAAAGLVGFVGLVVPHVVRLVVGPDHRRVLPLSGWAGAMLVVACDTFARSVVAPLELPIGVLTALLGAPVFFALLMRARRGLA